MGELRAEGRARTDIRNYRGEAHGGLAQLLPRQLCIKEIGYVAADQSACKCFELGLFLGDRWRQLSNSRRQLFGAANEIGQQSWVYVYTSFVLGQVSFVMGSQENLYVSLLRT